MHNRTGDNKDALGTVRLNRYLAECGVASRRDSDRIIEEGRVTVNGGAAAPGARIYPGRDEVRLDGKLLEGPRKKVVIAWYKPVGVTCTARDPHAGRTVTDAFRTRERLTYAGRLDRDSEGLLIMTNDGGLIDAMMRGANGHEKEYIVRTGRRISDAGLQHMRKGVYLRELDVTTRPCEIERLGEYTLRFVLTQGLNNQIRRMVRCEGSEVKRLKRIRVLNVGLGALKPGEQREVTGAELEELYRLAGLEGKSAPAGRKEDMRRYG